MKKKKLWLSTFFITGAATLFGLTACNGGMPNPGSIPVEELTEQEVFIDKLFDIRNFDADLNIAINNDDKNYSVKGGLKANMNALDDIKFSADLTVDLDVDKFAVNATYLDETVYLSLNDKRLKMYTDDLGDIINIFTSEVEEDEEKEEEKEKTITSLTSLHLKEIIANVSDMTMTKTDDGYKFVTKTAKDFPDLVLTSDTGFKLTSMSMEGIEFNDFTISFNLKTTILDDKSDRISSPETEATPYINITNYIGTMKQVKKIMQSPIFGLEYDLSLTHEDVYLGKTTGYASVDLEDYEANIDGTIYIDDPATEVKDDYHTTYNAQYFDENIYLNYGDLYLLSYSNKGLADLFEVLGDEDVFGVSIFDLLWGASGKVYPILDIIQDGNYLDLYNYVKEATLKENYFELVIYNDVAGGEDEGILRVNIDKDKGITDLAITNLDINGYVVNGKLSLADYKDFEKVNVEKYDSLDGLDKLLKGLGKIYQSTDIGLGLVANVTNGKNETLSIDATAYASLRGATVEDTILSFMNYRSVDLAFKADVNDFNSNNHHLMVETYQDKTDIDNIEDYLCLSYNATETESKALRAKASYNSIGDIYNVVMAYLSQNSGEEGDGSTIPFIGGASLKTIEKVMSGDAFAILRDEIINVIEVEHDGDKIIYTLAIEKDALNLGEDLLVTITCNDEELESIALATQVNTETDSFAISGTLTFKEYNKDVSYITNKTTMRDIGDIKEIPNYIANKKVVDNENQYEFTVVNKIMDILNDKQAGLSTYIQINKGNEQLIALDGGANIKLNALTYPDYNPLTTYEEGDRVLYENKNYECKANIITPEAWNVEHWKELTALETLDTVDVVIGGTLYNKDNSKNVPFEIAIQDGVASISFGDKTSEDSIRLKTPVSKISDVFETIGEVFNTEALEGLGDNTDEALFPILDMLNDKDYATVLDQYVSSEVIKDEYDEDVLRISLGNAMFKKNDTSTFVIDIKIKNNELEYIRINDLKYNDYSLNLTLGLDEFSHEVVDVTDYEDVGKVLDIVKEVNDLIYGEKGAFSIEGSYGDLDIIITGQHDSNDESANKGYYAEATIKRYSTPRSDEQLAAEEYDSRATYAVGEFAIYEGKTYECIVDITVPEGFNISHWEEMTYEEYKLAITGYNDILYVNYGEDELRASLDKDAVDTILAKVSDLLNVNFSSLSGDSEETTSFVDLEEIIFGNFIETIKYDETTHVMTIKVNGESLGFGDILAEMKFDNEEHLEKADISLLYNEKPLVLTANLKETYSDTLIYATKMGDASKYYNVSFIGDEEVLDYLLTKNEDNQLVVLEQVLDILGDKGIGLTMEATLDKDGNTVLILDNGKVNIHISPAPDYSANKTYAVGDYVTHSEKTYICISDISAPEEWTIAHWEEIELVDRTVAVLEAALHQVDPTTLEEYSALSTYAVGKYVLYNEKIYKCIKAITTGEAWDPLHWEEINNDGNLVLASQNGAVSFAYNGLKVRVEYDNLTNIVNKIMSIFTSGEPNVDESNALLPVLDLLDEHNYQAILESVKSVKVVNGKLLIEISDNLIDNDNYVANSAYGVGSYIKHDGKYYICISEIGSEGEDWNSAHWNEVASYDSEGTYSVGSYVMHEGNLYQCKSKINVAEPWTSDHWNLVEDNYVKVNVLIDNTGISIISISNARYDDYSMSLTLGLTDYEEKVIDLTDYVSIDNAASVIDQVKDILDTRSLSLTINNVVINNYVGDEPNYDKNKTYAVGELVTYNGKVYKCITAITVPEVFDSSKWVEATTADRRVATDYENNKNYALRDLIKYNGLVYECSVAHNSGVSFDATKWTLTSLVINGYAQFDLKDNISPVTKYDDDGNVIPGDPINKNIPLIGVDLMLGQGDYTHHLIIENTAEKCYLSYNKILNTTKYSAYSSANTYNVDDMVIYDDAVYKCVSKIASAEEWTPAHWETTTTGTEVFLYEYNVLDIWENVEHMIKTDDNVLYEMIQELMGNSIKDVDELAEQEESNIFEYLFKDYVKSMSLDSADHKLSVVVNADAMGLADDINVTANFVEAALFSETSTYELRDYVKYNDKFYECIEAVTTPGAWNTSNWKEVPGAYTLTSLEANGYIGENTEAKGKVVIGDYDPERVFFTPEQKSSSARVNVSTVSNAVNFAKNLDKDKQQKIIDQVNDLMKNKKAGITYNITVKESLGSLVPLVSMSGEINASLENLSFDDIKDMRLSIDGTIYRKDKQIPFDIRLVDNGVAYIYYNHGSDIRAMYQLTKLAELRDMLNEQAEHNPALSALISGLFPANEDSGNPLTKALGSGDYLSLISYFKKCYTSVDGNTLYLEMDGAMIGMDTPIIIGFDTASYGLKSIYVQDFKAMGYYISGELTFKEGNNCGYTAPTVPTDASLYTDLNRVNDIAEDIIDLFGEEANKEVAYQLTGNFGDMKIDASINFKLNTDGTGSLAGEKVNQGSINVILTSGNKTHYLDADVTAVLYDLESSEYRTKQIRLAELYKIPENDRTQAEKEEIETLEAACKDIEDAAAEKSAITFSYCDSSPRYNSSTQYVEGDSVYYSGKIYTCIKDAVGYVPTNTTYWKEGNSMGDTSYTVPVTTAVATSHGHGPKNAAANRLYGTLNLGTVFDVVGLVRELTSGDNPRFANMMSIFSGDPTESIFGDIMKGDIEALLDNQIIKELSLVNDVYTIKLNGEVFKVRDENNIETPEDITLTLGTKLENNKYHIDSLSVVGEYQDTDINLALQKVAYSDTFPTIDTTDRTVYEFSDLETLAEYFLGTAQQNDFVINGELGVHIIGWSWLAGGDLGSNPNNNIDVNGRIHIENEPFGYENTTGMVTLSNIKSANYVSEDTYKNYTRLFNIYIENIVLYEQLPGDYVIKDGNIYRCISAINGGESWNADHWELVGTTYDPSTTYEINDYALYDGKIYRCNTSISSPESWNEFHWTEISVANTSGIATYSASSTYAAGDHVLYGGQVYRCISKIETAESWNADHWVKVIVAGAYSSSSSYVACEFAKDDNSEYLLGVNGKKINYEPKLDKNGDVVRDANVCMEVTYERNNSTQAYKRTTRSLSEFIGNIAYYIFNYGIGVKKECVGQGTNLYSSGGASDHIPTYSTLLQSYSYNSGTTTWTMGLDVADLLNNSSLQNASVSIQGHSTEKIYKCSSDIENAEEWAINHWTEVGSTYSETQTYAVGDLVLKDGKIYRCTTTINTNEAWNIDHWELVTSIADYSSESTYAVGNRVVYNNKYYKCIKAITEATAWGDEAWVTEHWEELDYADEYDEKSTYAVGNYAVHEEQILWSLSASLKLHVAIDIGNINAAILLGTQIPSYSTARTYSYGDLMRYNGVIYRCVYQGQKISAGAFNPTYWVEYNMSDYVHQYVQANKHRVGEYNNVGSSGDQPYIAFDNE